MEFLTLSPCFQTFCLSLQVCLAFTLKHMLSDLSNDHEEKPEFISNVNKWPKKVFNVDCKILCLHMKTERGNGSSYLNNLASLPLEIFSLMTCPRN